MDEARVTVEGVVHMIEDVAAKTMPDGVTYEPYRRVYLIQSEPGERPIVADVRVYNGAKVEVGKAASFKVIMTAGANKKGGYLTATFGKAARG